MSVIFLGPSLTPTSGGSRIDAPYRRLVDEVRLALGTSRISGRGDVAWAFSEPVVTASVGGQQITMPVRMSVVLVKGDGQWLIHSAHLSVAFAAQEEGHSFANA